MSCPPEDKARRTRQQPGVLAERRLLGGIDGDESVGEVEFDGVAVEEVGQVHEVLAALGVGVGDDLVVGQAEAEDVGVDDYDGAGVGRVADGIDVEAMEVLYFAFGLALVNGPLVEQVSLGKS